MISQLLLAIITMTVLPRYAHGWGDEAGRLPTRCEACKYLSIELLNTIKRLNSRENIEATYSLDESEINKKTSYKNSEIRIMDAMEVACRNILSYQVDSKKPGSLRFSKEEHPTIKTFKELQERGAKVDIGIPTACTSLKCSDDLWDVPSWEVSQLKKACDNMIEEHEEDITEWFMNHRTKISLVEYLCENIVLKHGDKKCLNEKATDPTLNVRRTPDEL